MSIMKKLAGVFVEVEEEPPKHVPLNPALTLHQATPVLMEESSSYGKEFVERFEIILSEENKRNFPGHDYYEFIKMITSMDIPQEDVKYKAAFQAWKAVGGQTKEYLLKTAAAYRGIIEREVAEFKSLYDGRYIEQVASNEKEISAKNARIKTLEDEVANLRREVMSLEAENRTNTHSLQEKMNAFTSVSQSQLHDIDTQVRNINSYIQ